MSPCNASLGPWSVSNLTGGVCGRAHSERGPKLTGAVLEENASGWLGPDRSGRLDEGGAPDGWPPA